MPTDDEDEKKKKAATNSGEPVTPLMEAQQRLQQMQGDNEMRMAALEESRTAAELNKEALRSRKFENENAGRDPRRDTVTPLRTIEARERAAQKREAAAAAEAQRKEDFWNQGKEGERPEVRAAREARQSDFQQRQDSQRDRMDAALKPIREEGFARQAAEKQRQQQMQNPARRMAQSRLDNAGKGTLNYAEFRGPDGKQSTYMRPNEAGQQAQANTMAVRQEREAARQAEIAKAESDKKNQADMAMFQRLSSMPTPAAPAMPSPGVVNPQPPAQPAMQAAAPVTPGMQAARAGLPLWQRRTTGAAPAPQPQAATPAMGPVMRMMSSKTPWADAAGAIGDAAKSVGQGLQAGASFAGNVLSGKLSPLAGKSAIAPRRRTQTAQTQPPKNPLLARR